MLRVSQADDGSVWSYYMCKVCQEYVERYIKEDFDTCTCGDIFSSDPEGWEELRQEMLREGKGK